jgi:glycerate 2-kinase
MSETGNTGLTFREIAEKIFLEGVARVIPDRLISEVMHLDRNSLVIEKLHYHLDSFENIYVVGAGKASALMGEEVEKILGDRITEGHIVVKYGFSRQLRHIKITEAGHPVPDSNGFKAAREIVRICEKASANDLVICLFSGGGSSLLPDIPVGCTAYDMIQLTDLLVNCGADINEINAVRKHLSVIKGGQLARLAFPASLVNLIISDVPGDRLDVIASGPTVVDPTTFNQALAVLESYGLKSRLSPAIINYLNEGSSGKRPETPKENDMVFTRTHNILAGRNRMALEAAKKKALEYNFNALIIDDQLQGDIPAVAEYLVDTALKFRNDKDEVKPVCLFLGGETTVKMSGNGLGGRNQHLALASAMLLKNHPGITILCAGSDGNDGPTDATGAVVDSDTFISARQHGIEPEKYLTAFDSYHFFKKAGGHIITGPTLTNVMDIIVVLIQ